MTAPPEAAGARDPAAGPVLWVVDYLGHGGIGRYAVDLANTVEGSGTTVVATTDRGPVEGHRGASVVWFPRGADTVPAKLRGAVLGLVRAHRSVRRGDVAWLALGLRPGYELLLLLALRSGGATVVSTVHNRAPHQRGGASPVVTATARGCHHVVVHNDAVEAWARAHGMRTTRLPFLTPDLTAPLHPSTTREGLGVPDGRVVLLFLGYLLPYKGPDVLLRALALARATAPGLPVHVVMAGRPSPSLDLQGLVTELGLAGSVTLRAGWLEEAEMSDLLAAADVIALPYRHIDNSGIAAVARRRGLPALATDLPLMREVYQGAALFVRPDDEADLARGLVELPGRLPELAAAARQRAPEDPAEAYRAFVGALTVPAAAPSGTPARRRWRRAAAPRRPRARQKPTP